MLVAGLGVLFDQLSKSWARLYLSHQSSCSLIPGVLHLTLTTNTGGAFSLGAGNNLLFTCLVSGLVTLIFIWIVRQNKETPHPQLIELLGMGLLLGGALGNLLDRLTLGQVTDFLDLEFISFPVFNLADVFIDLGVVLIFVATFLKHKGKK